MKVTYHIIQVLAYAKGCLPDISLDYKDISCFVFLHVCSQVEVDVWGLAAAGSALNP